MHLSRSARKGEKAPYKPVLLLAVIDRIEQLLSMGVAGHRMINQNLIDLNPKLEQFFYSNWNQYVESDLFSPSFSTPFFHMSGEPFWKLALKKDANPQGSQVESHLYKFYQGAYIDEELMLFLIKDDTRNELRQLLIDLLQKKDLELPFDEPLSDVSVDFKSTDLQTAHMAFWSRFIEYSDLHNGLFACRKPSKDQWLTRTEKGVTISVVVKKKSCAIELNIKEDTKEKSKAIFNRILAERTHIEGELGHMTWHIKENSMSAKVYQEIERSFLVPQDELEIFKFFTERSVQYVKVFAPFFRHSSIEISQQNKPTFELPPEYEMCRLFQEYLRKNGISEGSVKKYSIQVACNVDVKAVIKKITGNESLYKVISPDDANNIRLEVKKSSCDINGNHMYSAGLSHYSRFLVFWRDTLSNTSGSSIVEKKERKGWSENEMILTLDLYFRTPYNKRTKSNPEIIELADIIGRTPASVVLRMANYLCFDIDEQKLGHKGMGGGARQCKPFWDKYVNNKELLRKDALLIKRESNQ